MCSFGSSPALWNLPSSAVGNQMSNGMWGWGNAGRPKNCSLLSVGKNKWKQVRGENIKSCYCHCTHAPWAMSLLNTPLQKRIWAIIRPDFMPVLLQLIRAVAPAWHCHLPCTVQGLLGGCSLCRQEVGTATVWARNTAGIYLVSCAEFPYPPPVQILCWVSVNSVNLLKKGTGSSFICKCMTACYLFNLLVIFGKWWNKLDINAVDWGADNTIPSEGFVSIAGHLWGLSFLWWFSIIYEDGRLHGQEGHWPFCMVRTFMWVCLGHLRLFGRFLWRCKNNEHIEIIWRSP